MLSDYFHFVGFLSSNAPHFKLNIRVGERWDLERKGLNWGVRFAGF